MKVNKGSGDAVCVRERVRVRAFVFVQTCVCALFNNVEIDFY